MIVKRALILLSVLAVLLSGCAAATPTMTRSQGMPPAGAPVAPFEEGKSSTGSAYAAGEVPEAKKLVVKNASLSIAVDDPAASLDRISRMAEEMGGFVVTSRLYNTTTNSGAEVQQGEITVRVPVEDLEDAMAQIHAETSQPVLRQDVDSEDVTDKYTDLQSRLRNLEATEAQLQEIMDMATETEDVLRVYNDLSQVREQIELIKGQIQYYEQSAAFSLISVVLVPNEAVIPLTIGGWQPAGVAKDALQATLNAFRFLVYAGIWIVLFALPVLFAIFFPIFLLIRLALAIRKRSRPKAPPPAPVAGD
ncbi:MAG: DUF4349 domain-containing protein [Chloroflexota bacterium]|nr:MAG: DUF4349 domain-containing protein [Chloroflexota bacterium]